MKVTVQTENIIEGLLKAAAIIPARAGAQYLRTIWLSAEGDKLSIMATDANIEFTGRYPVEVGENGLVGVQGKAFVELMRQLPHGAVQLVAEKDSPNLELRQGRRLYKLPVSGAEWFQSFSAFPEENSVIWSGDFFQDVLDKVIYCISDDTSSDALACLCMKPKGNGNIDVCGLNGYQFAMISFTHDDLAARLPENGILVQKKYLSDLKKWLGQDEIELNLTDKRLYLRDIKGMETLSLPRVSQEFIDYTSFTNTLESDSMQPLSVNRKELMEALGRILIFNTQLDRCTCIDLSSAEARLSAQGQEVGVANENLEISYNGDIRHIAFPTRSLLDVLGHFSSATVDFLLTGADGPCGIRGKDDPGYTVIIMPMTVTETTYFSEEEA